MKEEDERPLVFIHEHERASQVGLVCSIEGPVNRVVTTRTRRKDESGRHSPLSARETEGGCERKMQGHLGRGTAAATTQE